MHCITAVIFAGKWSGKYARVLGLLLWADGLWQSLFGVGSARLRFGKRAVNEPDRDNKESRVAGVF